MPNFSSKEHRNTLNPYNLSPEEAQKICKAVEDERFSNPSGGYFLLELEDKEIEIPKQEKIGIKQNDGKVNVVSVIEYVTLLLDKEDST